MLLWSKIIVTEYDERVEWKYFSTILFLRTLCICSYFLTFFVLVGIKYLVHGLNGKVAYYISFANFSVSCMFSWPTIILSSSSIVACQQYSMTENQTRTLLSKGGNTDISDGSYDNKYTIKILDDGNEQSRINTDFV